MMNTPISLPTVINALYKISSIWMLLLASFAYGEEAETIEQTLLQCKQNYGQDSVKRLACFDAVAGTAATTSLAKNVARTDAETGSAATTQVKTAKHAYFGNTVEHSLQPLSYVERKWRLNSKDNWDISDLEAHHLNYIVTSYSSDPNDVASSPTRPNLVNRDLSNNDLAFQISLKTQLLDDLPLVRDLPWVTSSRLWGAYSQQSFWQVYDSENSRPMRENDFEPELILSLGLDNIKDNQRRSYIPRMVNLGLVHESNGRSNPISRSWNRLYLETAWELNDAYTLIFRPWWRIPEDRADDDNPDIDKYLGYGDLTLRWDNVVKSKGASLMMRNNLRSDNKGYVKLDTYYRPFDRDNLKLYMMLTHGYGNSLVDYNHSDTTFGIGFAVGE
jgi:phospholipase A1/A2